MEQYIDRRIRSIPSGAGGCSPDGCGWSPDGCGWGKGSQIGKVILFDTDYSGRGDDTGSSYHGFGSGLGEITFSGGASADVYGTGTRWCEGAG